MTDMQKKIFFFFIFKQIFEHAHNTSHVGHTRSVLAVRWFDLDWTIHLWKKNYRNRQKYSYMNYYVKTNKLCI